MAERRSVVRREKSFSAKVDEASKKIRDLEPETPDDFDDIRDLEDALRIDEHALEEALRDQPALFYRVSKAYALEVSRRDAAKQALADAEAEADLAFREEARAEEQYAAERASKTKGREGGQSKIKLTEGEVRAKVQTDKNVVRARDRLTERAEIVGKLGALKDAFQQRSYALKDLAGLYIANYYTASENNAADRAVRQRDASDARARMNAMRRGE